jgi:BirA family transcriptional regulator, biotin operon repressor / biotin---[acetyl-CoA-carboxylase] ligase
LLKIQPKTFFVGKNLIFLPSCHSTNDIASEIIQNKEFIDGTVILTDHQTAGRGQRGNRWESKPGENLLMSIVLKTDFLPLSQQFDLSMCAAVSIFEALSRLQIPHLSIKWPNDIYIGQKKIGGILIENNILGTKMNNSIIGIGINVSQQSFENPRASSLSKELINQEIDKYAIAEKICEQLEEHLNELQKSNGQSVREIYLNNLFGKDQRRSFKTEEGTFEGMIKSVSVNGQLIVLSQNQEKYYNIKEIEHLFDE